MSSKEVNASSASIDWNLCSEFLAHRMGIIGAESLTYGLYITFWYSILLIPILYEVPLEDGILPFALVFLTSGILLCCLKVATTLVKVFKYLNQELRPPYENCDIGIRISSSRELERLVLFESVAKKASSIGTFYLIVVVIWLSVVLFGIQIVETPIKELDQLLKSIPPWFSEPISSYISNKTGVSLNTVLQHVSNPALFLFFLIIYGPFFVFASLSAWNFIYAFKQIAYRLYLSE